MGRTVTELLTEMPSWELTYWMAYSRLQPFGQYHRDIQHAEVMHFQYEVNRDRSKNTRPYLVADFLPRQTRPKAQDLSWEQQKALWKSVSKVVAKDKTNG